MRPHPTTSPLCPECRTPMGVYEHAGVPVDICPICHGLWFDGGELRRAEGVALDVVPTLNRAIRLRPRYCPRCSKGRLDQVEVRGASGLLFDSCGRCEGLFLEAGVLRRVQHLKAHRERQRVSEEARTLEAFAEERDKALRPQPRGIEIESAWASADNLVTFLLDLPSEEYSDTERTPFALYGLVLTILAVWAWQAWFVPESVWISLAATRNNLFSGERVYTLLTAVFLHGDWLHVLGNLYFLWIFGDDVEDRLGSFWFLACYLIWGVLSAAISLVMTSPEMGDVPQLGASGAISGAMGAYFVLFPHKRIVTRFAGLFTYGFVIKLPAWVCLGFWILLDLTSAVRGVPGVGWWAHIGGFALGALVGLAYRFQPPKPRRTK